MVAASYSGGRGRQNRRVQSPLGGWDDDDLFGEVGRDALFGDANNGLLDGSYDVEVDAMNGVRGLDEFIYRYFEYRSVTSMTWRTVCQPSWTWVNGFPVLRWGNIRIQVPRTITFRSTSETESVVDNNFAEPMNLLRSRLSN